MNRIKSDIVKNMGSIVKDEQERLLATVKFPSDFSGFDGHFPGRPIVPGVCLIQTAALMLEQTYKGRVNLKKIIGVKFLSALSVGDSAEFLCTVEHKGQKELGAVVQITSGDKKIASLNLLAQVEPV